MDPCAEPVSGGCGRCRGRSPEQQLSFGIDFQPLDGRIYGFVYAHLLSYLAEKNPAAELQPDALADRLSLAFSTHDVVLLGWRLNALVPPDPSRTAGFGGCSGFPLLSSCPSQRTLYLRHRGFHCPQRMNLFTDETILSPSTAHRLPRSEGLKLTHWLLAKHKINCSIRQTNLTVL
jgi:hypothetical protein